MITTPPIPLRLLRRAEAAKHIHEKWGYPCSPRTLSKYAVIGGGPPFRKAGRYPLYHPDDLDRWLTDKLSGPVASTSALASESDSDQRPAGTMRLMNTPNLQSSKQEKSNV